MCCHSVVRTLVASILCVLVFSAPQAGINRWTINGPPGGIFTDLEASTTDGNVFYALYSRSFHRSEDGGVTWQSYDFNAQVTDIAVDPANGNRIVVTVLDTGLFRSLDGGRTFTQIAPAGQLWAAAIGPNNVIYYSTPTTLRRSTDGGDSFGAPLPAAQTISQIVVSATDANSIFARRGPFFMHSSDGGGSWSETTISSVTDFISSLERLSSGTLVAALSSGLYTSGDDGVTWTLRLAGSFSSVAADPSTPDTLIAASLGPNLLMRSTNGGANWSPFGAAPRGGVRRAVVSHASSDRLVVAGDRGVQRSVNGAATWSYAASGPIASDSLSLVTTVAANSRVYNFTGSTTLFSAANDSDWERLDALDNESPGQATLAVKPGAPLTLFLASFGRGVFRSIDGGHSWSFPNADLAGLAVDSLGFDPVDPSIMYASTAFGGVTPSNAFYRSVDGGVSWSPRSVNLPEVHAFRMAVDPANGARIFLAGYQGFFPAGVGGLYLSTDSGVNWNRIGFAGQDVNDVAIDPSDSNRVYAATATGLQVSTNGGVSFVPNDAYGIITTQPARRIHIDPVIPSTIYAASVDPGACCGPQASSFVLRSVDRGQTWETLRAAADSPSWYVGQLTLDPNVPSLIYVSTGVRGMAAYEIVNDLAVTIGGHSGLRPVGVPSTFQLRGEHLGSLAATGVKLVTALPAGVTNVSTTTDRGTCAVAGTTLTCNVPVLRPAQVVNVQVTYTPPSAMLLGLQTTISAHERDTVVANNSATASAITGEVTDLRVTAAPSVTTVTRGGNVTYAVQVSNQGPVDSTSSVLTFTPGSGLSLGAAPSGCAAAGTAINCNLGALANGAAQSFQFSATAQAAGSLTATAAITAVSTASDPDVTNNNAAAAITSNDPPPPPPSNGGGGGGGGGSMEWMTLLALLTLLGARQLTCAAAASRSPRPPSVPPRRM